MSSFESNVELRRYNSNQTNTSYQQQQNGAPSDVHSLDPTSVGTPVYDSVPGEKQRPPPLPEARKTTSNTMYATRGDTLHPTSTMLEMNPPEYSSDGLEAEIDYMSSKCLRVTCLSILVMISLFLAIVAVVLVLLLWFGVYGPAAEACSSSGTSNSNQAVTGGAYTTTIVPTPSSPSQCLCPTPDLSPIKAQIEQEAANLTELIRDITFDISLIEQNNNNTDRSLASQSSFISSTVSDINSTCYEALANLTAQNVSLAGLEFEAELRNVGVYSSCIYEYLSNCSMPTDVSNCTTGYHDVIVDGYYNLDLACHIEVSGSNALLFAPLTNLRMTARSGETIQSGDSASVRLAKSEVRCECALVPLYNGATRVNDVYCSVFRSRCPVTSNFENVIIITP
ncbi:PREDICTED: uncharacterized protein LOC100632103 isoform X2 [Amphimedon queenslandica]|uniref:Uncharacterized protein n=1 Tax=Amphimedon queenslandica TaxID=400682 RepID=A0A1X7VQH4_AMPQE|nr:PREDICTED: uncharacterized protein LOC100632103 isoform X2 [Amphimedon queenslandica]|eukprot:XP_003382989.1 PREDICTED: uncharacterized protein LOC100632103 isoform X2 [Amphimedon queenslandica]